MYFVTIELFVIMRFRKLLGSSGSCWSAVWKLLAAVDQLMVTVDQLLTTVDQLLTKVDQLLTTVDQVDNS